MVYPLSISLHTCSAGRKIAFKIRGHYFASLWTLNRWKPVIVHFTLFTYIQPASNTCSIYIYISSSQFSCGSQHSFMFQQSLAINQPIVWVGVLLYGCMSVCHQCYSLFHKLFQSVQSCKKGTMWIASGGGGGGGKQENGTHWICIQSAVQCFTYIYGGWSNIYLFENYIALSLFLKKYHHHHVEHGQANRFSTSISFRFAILFSLFASIFPFPSIKIPIQNSLFLSGAPRS